MKLVSVYSTEITNWVAEWLYDLLREREPEVNISHGKLPSWDEHLAFIARQPFRFWYLIQVDADFVGYVSATDRNEIGIVLSKKHRGKAYGPEAVCQLMALHKPLPAIPSARSAHWLANIAPENEHSKHMFTKLGFRKIQETYEFNEEETNGKKAAS